MLEKLKTFKEDEFADLLHKCHNIIRNRDKLDPAAAFDEIAKILFVKVHIERDLKTKRSRQNHFTEDYLDNLPGKDPINLLFSDTKDAYKNHQIFRAEDRIALKADTSKAVVKELQAYNLSDTSEDIKGIAFERFLGRTFRGEIGQFFTPRPIVEFMIRFLEPQEGQIVCDPASGSGGFLIRFFEIVREQILKSLDEDYQAFKASIEADKKLSDVDKATQLTEKYEELQQERDQKREGSRLWKLANRCIYGTDANERMARTSKMNMIMHGDGHGGVHHHDGFLNVNGIFEGRFDLILTNPPFGANVEPSDKVQVETLDEDTKRRYTRMYGNLFKEAQERVEAATGKAIASLFELPSKDGKGEIKGKIKTEILFIERCLSLLKPGGKLGIVLPESIFNNPSLEYVRTFAEDRAKILAVVSLPQETFFSSGASVKASLLFLQKFTEEEKATFEATRAQAQKEVDDKYAPDIAAEHAKYEAQAKLVKEAEQTRKDVKAKLKKAEGEVRETLEGDLKQAEQNLKAHKEQLKTIRSEVAKVLKEIENKKYHEARALLKERFSYFVFFYEAEHVGITSTGEPDYNELYRDEKNPMPPGVEQTVLEIHQDFRANPEAYLLGNNE
jgi:type I restriction enzyme M protein